MSERRWKGALNRLLQIAARSGPGSTGLRVFCHRLRGVTIGEGVWIGYDSIIETSRPELVTIGKNVEIGIRTTIIAHFQEDAPSGVTVEDDAFIGPGAVILPNVKIGQGAVVTAGSVVTRSVPPQTVVQGNPAKPIAKCNTPLTQGTPLDEFQRNLRPLGRKKG